VIQEATHSFKVLLWDWISCFGISNLWNSMVVLFSLWFTYFSSSHCSSFLWQQVCLTFSCQSCVSLA